MPIEGYAFKQVDDVSFYYGKLILGLTSVILESAPEGDGISTLSKPLALTFFISTLKKEKKKGCRNQKNP